MMIVYPDRHHQKARSNLGLKKQWSDVQKVLFLLVESGFFYLAIQVSFFMHMSTMLLSDSSCLSWQACCSALWAQVAQIQLLTMQLMFSMALVMSSR
jgi:hypothetical protein